MTEIRLATLDDLPTIETTLGLAFEDDPVWRWLIGRRNRPAARMGSIIGAIARLRVEESTAWMTADGAAIAVWAAPKRWRIERLRFMRYGGRPVFAAGPQVVAEVEAEDARREASEGGFGSKIKGWFRRGR